MALRDKSRSPRQPRATEPSAGAAGSGSLSASAAQAGIVSATDHTVLVACACSDASRYASFAEWHDVQAGIHSRLSAKYLQMAARVPNPPEGGPPIGSLRAQGLCCRHPDCKFTPHTTRSKEVKGHCCLKCLESKWSEVPEHGKVCEGKDALQFVQRSPRRP